MIFLALSNHGRWSHHRLRGRRALWDAWWARLFLCGTRLFTLARSNNHKEVVRLTEEKLWWINKPRSAFWYNAATVTEKETYLEIKFLPYATEFNFCHSLQHFWTWVSNKDWEKVNSKYIPHKGRKSSWGLTEKAALSPGAPVSGAAPGHPKWRQQHEPGMGSSTQGRGRMEETSDRKRSHHHHHWRFSRCNWRGCWKNLT